MIKINKLLPGYPELCPICAGRGSIADGMLDYAICPLCCGDRVVVNAEVSGVTKVRITAKEGDELKP